MNDALRTALTRLRLSGLASTLDVRLQEATGNHLGHAEFLELVLQDELLIRNDRLVERRVKAAGRFLREARDVLLLGPPGTGKSHLAQAIGHAVIKAGGTVLYRSIFDLVRDFLSDEALGGQ